MTRLAALSVVILAMLAGCARGWPPGPAPGSRGGDGPPPWAGPGRGAGMGWGRGPMMGPGMGAGMGTGTARHRTAMMGGVPAAYRGLTNPLPVTPAVIARGAGLYRANCAACHGPDATGNGPAAASLSPPPGNLRWLMGLPIATDGYLMWTISAGGTAFGTAMPAFAPALGETERWSVIRYLRSLRGP